MRRQGRRHRHPRQLSSAYASSPLPSSSVMMNVRIRSVERRGGSETCANCCFCHDGFPLFCPRQGCRLKERHPLSWTGDNRGASELSRRDEAICAQRQVGGDACEDGEYHGRLHEVEVGRRVARSTGPSRRPVTLLTHTHDACRRWRRTLVFVSTDGGENSM